MAWSIAGADFQIYKKIQWPWYEYQRCSLAKPWTWPVLWHACLHKLVVLSFNWNINLKLIQIRSIKIQANNMQRRFHFRKSVELDKSSIHVLIHLQVHPSFSNFYSPVEIYQRIFLSQVLRIFCQIPVEGDGSSKSTDQRESIRFPRQVIEFQNSILTLLSYSC